MVCRLLAIPILLLCHGVQTVGLYFFFAMVCRLLAMPRGSKA
jgi:hypothetical protein